MTNGVGTGNGRVMQSIELHRFSSEADRTPTVRAPGGENMGALADRTRALFSRASLGSIPLPLPSGSSSGRSSREFLGGGGLGESSGSAVASVPAAAAASVDGGRSLEGGAHAVTLHLEREEPAPDGSMDTDTRSDGTETGESVTVATDDSSVRSAGAASAEGSTAVRDLVRVVVQAEKIAESIGLYRQHYHSGTHLKKEHPHQSSLNQYLFQIREVFGKRGSIHLEKGVFTYQTERGKKEIDLFARESEYATPEQLEKARSLFLSLYESYQEGIGGAVSMPQWEVGYKGDKKGDLISLGPSRAPVDMKAFTQELDVAFPLDQSREEEGRSPREIQEQRQGCIDAFTRAQSAYASLEKELLGEEKVLKQKRKTVLASPRGPRQRQSLAAIQKQWGILLQKKQVLAAFNLSAIGWALLYRGEEHYVERMEQGYLQSHKRWYRLGKKRIPPKVAQNVRHALALGMDRTRRFDYYTKVLKKPPPREFLEDTLLDVAARGGRKEEDLRAWKELLWKRVGLGEERVESERA